MNMDETDTLQRFVFDNVPVRGALVRLKASWQHVLSRHDYPLQLRRILGEMTATSVLLAANLKFEGALILQIHSSGPLAFAVAECYSDRTIRATARWEGELTECPLPELLGPDGNFVITLDPKTENGKAWQGIVALEGDSIASLVENYMHHSEQLETKLIVAANDHTVAGLLLQRLPDGQGDPEGWTRVSMLGKTVSPDELLTLNMTELLHRLFHEETVRIFDREGIHFSCTCSRERVSEVLKMVGAQEVGDVLLEQGSIEITCDFCNQRYVFDEDDANELFQFDVIAHVDESRH